MSTACCERAEERELTAQELVEAFTCRPVSEQVELLGKVSEHRCEAFATSYLDYIHSFRYDDPREAGRLAAAAAGLVNCIEAPTESRIQLYCRAVGLFASTSRMLGNYGAAAEALRIGIRLSRQWELKSTEAELLLKATYVFADEGRFAEGYELANEAVLLYANLGDIICVARALVDRSIVGKYLGRHEEAAAGFHAALKVLPSGDGQCRASAYSGLAGVYEDQGNLRLASECLEKATALVPGRMGRAILMWQRGELAFSQGDLEASEQLLREARDTLGSANPHDAALVSVDLVKTLFGLGKIAEATEIATQMAALLSRARKNQVLTTAIMSLARDALAGQLTMNVIEKARAQLFESRGL